MNQEPAEAYRGDTDTGKHQQTGDDRFAVAEQYGFEPVGDGIGRSSVTGQEMENYVLTVLEEDREVAGERIDGAHITDIADRYDSGSCFAHVPVYGNTVFYGTHPDDPGTDRREADIVALTPDEDGIVARYVEVKSFRAQGVEKAADQLEQFAAYAESQGWDTELEAAFWDQDNVYRYRFDPDTVQDG